MSEDGTKQVAAGSVAGKQLQAIVGEIERVNEEIKELQEQRKEMFSHAKDSGFSVATIKDVLKLRKMEPEERETRLSLIDQYMAALGMLRGTPLGDAAAAAFTAGKQTDVEDAIAGTGDYVDQVIAGGAKKRKGAGGAGSASTH